MENRERKKNKSFVVCSSMSEDITQQNTHKQHKLTHTQFIEEMS